MKKSTPAANPDAYVTALNGWQRVAVEQLRAAACAETALDEVIKWRNLVYLCNGPVLVIRAEAHRVLFGLWRGQRLRGIEPRLKPGGKYEMATIVLGENDEIASSRVRRLIKEAVRLNRQLGDPTRIG